MCYAAQTTSLTPTIYDHLGVIIATPSIRIYYYIKTDQNNATSFNWTPTFVASPYIHCLQIPCNGIYSIHFNLGASTGVYDFFIARDGGTGGTPLTTYPNIASSNLNTGTSKYGNISTSIYLTTSNNISLGFL